MTIVTGIIRSSWYVARFQLLVRPHEVEPWFHSWYRGRVETLDAKYNLVALSVSGAMVSFLVEVG